MKNQLFALLLTVIVCFLYLESSVSAQSPDNILRMAAKSLGGEKALRRISSKQIKGRIVRLRDGATGNFLLQTSQPNSFAQTFDIGGVETANGFNGKSGWLRNLSSGLQTLTGEAGKNLQAEANYRNNLWLNYKKDKSKAFLNARINIDGKPADVVSITTAKGVLIKTYFDPVSKLPLRDEMPQINLINDYSDYREIDGVREPFTIRISIDGEQYEIKLDSVTHNSSIAKTAFDFPSALNEPLTNIPALLKEIQANADRIDNILENYTYTQTNTMRELGKDGRLTDKESETFQVSFYKGYKISRLIEKNGKPLPQEDQAKFDKQAERKVAEIDEEIAKKQARALKQKSNGTPDDEGARPSIAETLRASNLLNPRRERFRGRDVIVFDFEPNPNFDYKNAKSFLKLFGKTAGVIWVDAQDKQVARLEAVLADNYKIGGGLLANLKKGASFTLENDRINDEVWLPSSADVSLSVKVLLVKGININQLIKYGNYQKFNSEVKDSKVDEIKKP